MISSIELQEKVQLFKTILESQNTRQWKADKNILEGKLSEENIWSTPEVANELNQKLAITNKKLEQLKSISSLIEELQIAFELNEEDFALSITKNLDSKLENLQNSEFLNGKFDGEGVYLSLYAGAGGLDAQDWTSMICSMYQAFAKNQGWNCKVISLNLGEEGGLKSTTLEINGENVYGLLKEEAGVHRLVRISPFNSGGTRETSFAMVEVIPNNLSQKIDLVIPEKDIRIDTFMASGKGGQGVNTTYSAVRIVHLPTNISVQCQDERSQQMNKDRAMQVLKNKLVAIELKKQKEFADEIKGNLGQNEWGSQIRSYTLHPYKLIKDHRSGYETADISSVLEYGNLLPFIWAQKKHKIN
jgi:peptide chain release factor 2